MLDLAERRQNPHPNTANAPEANESGAPNRLSLQDPETGQVDRRALEQLGKKGINRA